jgi:hypothetical protein
VNVNTPGFLAARRIMSTIRPYRFGALLFLLEVAFVFLSEQRQHPASSEGFLIGDCPFYAATVESLVRDGDWDLRNQLPGELKDHVNFFALSKDGRLVIKQSTLMPLLSLPFFAVFGSKGFLIFNVFQVFVLIFGIAQLAGNSPWARLLALAGYLSTPFLAYTYNYSPDILGAALVVWAYVFAIRRWAILCGLLAGLAIWAKVYLALVILPAGIIVVPQGWRAVLGSAIAAAAALTPMFLINAHLYGAPWITGYDREARVGPDGFELGEHYSRFHQPIVSGLGNLLFDKKIGMLQTAPLWFLWPAGLWFAMRRRVDKTPAGSGACGGSRQTSDSDKSGRPATSVTGLESAKPSGSNTKGAAIAITMAMLANVLFFARYDEWDASFFGNRFLFPALALGLALQGSFSSFLWDRPGARR